MPRNASGIYSLPNPPVVPDTTIESLDENQTRDDMAVELTNSLDRNGRGGMLAPFRIFDGTMAVPGLAFLNDPNCGIWRESADVWHAVAGGANQLQWSVNGTRLENPFATGTNVINASGTAARGASFDAVTHGLVVTTEAAGNAISITNAGATPKTGYLFSGATAIGLVDNPAFTGNGLYIDSAASLVRLLVGGTARLTADVTGITVSGGAAFTGDVRGSSYRTIAAAVGSVLAGEGLLQSTAVGGAVLHGFGSTNDLTLLNKTGQNVMVTPTGTQRAHFGSSIVIPATSGVYLDGFGDTFIYENVANTIGLTAGGTLAATLTSTVLSLLTASLVVTRSTNGVIGTFQNANASPFILSLHFNGAAPNNASNYFFNCVDTVQARIIGYSNGGIHNVTANNVNISDARAKTFIDAPVTPHRERLRALDLRVGRYSDATDPQEFLMLTAQQVQSVFPELVTQFADTDMLGIYEQRLAMIHLKVTQEHEDEIEQLKARIAALERNLH